LCNDTGPYAVNLLKRRMKRPVFPLSLAATAALILLSFSGCLKNNITRTYTVMEPVLKSKSVVLEQVKADDPEPLVTAGKIYIRGNYLFVNELNKGVHIINNADPAHPRSVSFIPIPGNVDIAVSGDYLYADMFADMLTINIEDPVNAYLSSVTANVFPERIYAGSSFLPDTSMVVVDWIRKEITVQVDDQRPDICAGCVFDLAANSGPAKAPIPGIGGSMARFAVVNRSLYTVNNSSLGVYDITDAARPEIKNNISLGWGIETIYPFENRLFVGSNTGVFIFNIDDPANPKTEGTFSHATACDPVVADHDYAFVTLRSGTACSRASNQLDILDISDVLQPKLLKTYDFSNPHGLGKDGNLLFICDGNQGLKIYDATDVLDLKLIKHIKDMPAFDVIPWNNNLILTSATGLYQFDYSNRNNIRLQSVIKTGAK